MARTNKASNLRAFIPGVLGLIGTTIALLMTGQVQAGAGWGDTTNSSPDAAISATDVNGNLKVRTYYANSPQGMQADALTGAMTRDTGLPLRKFVDGLPTVGAPLYSTGSSTDGTYIPIAVADTTTYSDADYYEIAVVEYTQRMHADLAKATTLRGYVQIDPYATDLNAGLCDGVATPCPAQIAGSKAVALMQVDGVTPVLISRPSKRPAAVKGFEQVPAYSVERPYYLGPTIIATHGHPTRLKFYNGLPAGRGVTDANGFHRNGDLFIPTDHTLFGGGEGPTQKAGADAFRDLLCGDTLVGPNNAPDTTTSSCAGGLNADGTTTLPGFVHVPAFDLYTENREEVHLHGGDNPWISDGTPHQWIAPAADETNASVAANYQRGAGALNVPDMPNPGPGAATYYFPNGQSGRLMFYHDHATGLTRLNVYVGTAAGYLLVDNNERALNALTPGGEIPLVIQEKTFVPKDIATQDAKWDTTHWGQEGDLWFPHVYETNQDPLSADATNPVGRWDGASFFWPVFPQNYQTPTGEYGNASTTPEAFMDTPIVNGMAYPTMTVDPKTYRFRILSVANDRMMNLSLFVADPALDGVSANGLPLATGTEVRMVPFTSPNSPTVTTYTCPTDGVSAPGTPLATPIVNGNGTITRWGWTESGPNTAGATLYPNSFPCAGGLEDTGWGQADNRPGGVPDPTMAGPDIIRIGSEGGLLPQPAVIPATPVNYEYNKRSVTVLNVLERGLWLGPAERADVVVDFSKYAGKTLILYNDSGAPVPAGDPRIDYYTGDGDQTASGGAPNTDAGYGPNTRTIMQIKVSANAADAPLDVAALGSQLLTAYVATQPAPIVPTVDYADTPTAGVATALGITANAPYERIYTGSIYLNKYNALQIPVTSDSFYYTPADTLNCNSQASCAALLRTLRQNGNGGLALAAKGASIKAYVESKAIQELFEPDYGRMNATLGVELPFTNVNVQTTIPLAYVDPATETINPGEVQFWKITHNGVDSHPVHFHFINVQVINRVGWDGTIKPPAADELGWKETVKMHPLEDVIVAVRTKTPPATPFGMPHSYRQPAPNEAPTDNHGITQIDPATGNAPLVPYTNNPVDYGSEYVWHCHILGHEENDFMRPFIFRAHEVPAPAFTMVSATAVANGIQVQWNDPTPVPSPVTAYDPLSAPTGFLGNPNNEIGFRVERALVNGGVAGPYTALASGLSTINAITGQVNSPANSASYVDEPAINVALPAPPVPMLVSATATAVTLDLPALPAGASGYNVYRNGLAAAIAFNKPAGPFVDTAVAPGATYTYTIASVITANAPGDGYSYRVVAVTAAGETLSDNTVLFNGAAVSLSSPSSPPLSVLMPPTSPTGITVTNPTVNSLTVNWPAAAAAQQVSGYQVSMNGAAAVAASSPDLVTGLAANTTYSFVVFASNATGTSTGSAPAQGLTLPDAPSALTAGTTTDVSVALSWTAPANAAGISYVVQGLPAGASVVYTGTAALVSGLAANTSYNFTVVSMNASGASAASNAVTVTTLSTAPTALVASLVTDTTVNLSWTAPPNGAGLNYTVQGLPAGATATYNGTTAVVSGLADNTSYTFTVIANGAAGPSAPSNAVTVLTLPAVPTALAIGTPTATSLTLNWTAPLNSAGLTYVVQTLPAGATVTYTGTSAVVDGLAGNTSYTFAVAAVNATGTGAASTSATGTTLAGAPSALTVGAITETTVDLSWTAPANAAGLNYTVQGLPAGATATYNGTTAVVSGLVDNSSYTFTVIANGPSGASAASNAVNALTLPAAPTALAIGTPTATGLTLTWTAPLNSAGLSYVVQTLPAGATVTYTGTSAVVDGLAGNTSYTFAVAAVNATGTGAASTSATGTTLAGAPTALTVVSVGETSASLSWTAPANGAGLTYAVQGLPAGATATYNGTTAVVSGLVGNSSYSFTVIANGPSGASAASNAINALTLPAAPTAPVIGTTTETTMALGWTAPPGAAPLSYSVQGLPAGATATYNGTSAVVGGLVGNSSYTFSIAAQNASGIGAASTGVTGLTLPAAPGALTVGTITANSIALSWNAPPTGASSYVVLGLPAGATASYSGTTAVVSGLNWYTDYTFSVAAANATGTGAASAPVTAKTLPIVPGVPACCTFAGRTPTSVTVGWTAPATGPAMSYTVQVATNASFTRGLQTVLNVLATSYQFTTLNANATYYVRVMAVNTVGSSAYSTGMQMVGLPPAPAAPVAVVDPITTAAPTITLSFAAPAAGDTYTVYQQTRANGGLPWNAAVAVATGVTGTTWNTGALTPDQQYRYSLVAVNALGSSAVSANSNAVTARQLAGAPSALGATNVTPVTTGVGRRSVILNWSLPAANGATVTSIRVVRANGATLTAPFTNSNLAATATTTTVGNLLRNATYTFQVQTVTAGGVNGSSSLTITTLP